jgi:hypothetical protein
MPQGRDDWNVPGVLEGTITFGVSKPLFPYTVSVGDASITLNADGSWSGDKAAFIRNVADVKSWPSYGQDAILMWLVVNAISK